MRSKRSRGFVNGNEIEIDAIDLHLAGAQRLGEAEVGEQSSISPALIESWVRVLAGVGVAIFALSQLEGLVQVVVLLLAGALVAVTGLGLFRLLPDKRN